MLQRVIICPYCRYIPPRDLRSPQGPQDVLTKNQQHLPLTPSYSTIRYSEFLAQMAPHSLESILPKAGQSTDVCTLVSRNGQGKTVYRSCGLPQAGVSTQMSTSILHSAGSREKGGCPPGGRCPSMFLPQAHEHQVRPSTEEHP